MSDIVDRLRRPGLPAVCAEAAAEIELLRLQEVGAKEAFGVVVDDCDALRGECKRLQALLDGAHEIIRRNAASKKLT
ncbi:hypothetical protein [Sphaerotilus uruguayifluvii]|uniref:Uncharacterized protein n=1 Tax=Sphaerotilus uruguayifluvii TaxID=2735897 RepID=A0ABX2FYD5_9BURK|nr:hypothetical protein [Leptothrix sp. C29]NRT54790.1 hypothetical protein [Leptothrix sp. C29]